MANGGNIDDDDDDYYDYDNSQNNLESQYKKYFKFDPDAWDAWGKMLYDTLNDIVEHPSNVWYISPKSGDGFQYKSIPVNSWNPNTGKGNSLQYLGSNYQGQPIWKKKYFAFDPIQTSYINHIQAHAVYFIKEPHYYKGLFDILN
jgi:hypothetical protein